MREKNFAQFFNVTKDAELEALGEAYIQAAHKRNLSVSAACKIITELWEKHIPETNQENIFHFISPSIMS